MLQNILTALSKYMFALRTCSCILKYLYGTLFFWTLHVILHCYAGFAVLGYSGGFVLPKCGNTETKLQDYERFLKRGLEKEIHCQVPLWQSWQKLTVRFNRCSSWVSKTFRIQSLYNWNYTVWDVKPRVKLSGLFYNKLHEIMYQARFRPTTYRVLTK